MSRLNLSAIERLKQMARERHSVSMMVRELFPGTNSSVPNPVEVLNTFRTAFHLTLAQAKPITDWLAYENGTKADENLDSLVWPCIEANRKDWEREEAD